MTLEDTLDLIGHHNMAVAVQAAGLAHVLEDPAARQSAEQIRSEALVVQRLIRAALSEMESSGELHDTCNRLAPRTTHQHASATGSLPT